jgi:hypothetical protein
MLPIAHAGHWAINLLYVAPLVFAVGVLGYQTMKDRRELKREGGEARPAPDDAGPTPD